MKAFCRGCHWVWGPTRCRANKESSISINQGFRLAYGLLLHIKVWLLVLLCAVKTVEGDFRFCWMISPNVGQTHKENPNLVRIFIWHLHWMIYTNNTTNYTNIDTQKSVHFAVPRTETSLKNASDLYMKYMSYAEHCRPCTRLSSVNLMKRKWHWTVSIRYSLFEDHRSVPSFGPGFFCLNSGLTKFNSVWVCARIFAITR